MTFRIFGFVPSTDAEDVVTDWLDPLLRGSNDDVKLATKFITRVNTLRQQPIAGWKFPSYLPVKEGLGEIRFEFKGVQYRAFGFFGVAAGNFTIVCIGTHKGKRYKPHDAIELSVARKNQLLRSSSTCLPIDHLFADE